MGRRHEGTKAEEARSASEPLEGTLRASVPPYLRDSSCSAAAWASIAATKRGWPSLASNKSSCTAPRANECRGASASSASRPVANDFADEALSPAVVNVCNFPSWHEMNCMLSLASRPHRSPFVRVMIERNFCQSEVAEIGLHEGKLALNRAAHDDSGRLDRLG